MRLVGKIWVPDPPASKPYDGERFRKNDDKECVHCQRRYVKGIDDGAGWFTSDCLSWYCPDHSPYGTRTG